MLINFAQKNKIMPNENLAPLISPLSWNDIVIKSGFVTKEPPYTKLIFLPEGENNNNYYYCGSA